MIQNEYPTVQDVVKKDILLMKEFESARDSGAPKEQRDAAMSESIEHRMETYEILRDAVSELLIEVFRLRNQNALVQQSEEFPSVLEP